MEKPLTFAGDVKNNFWFCHALYFVIIVAYKESNEVLYKYTQGKIRAYHLVLCTTGRSQ